MEGITIWRICKHCWIITEFPSDNIPPIMCGECNKIYKKGFYEDLKERPLDDTRPLYFGFDTKLKWKKEE